MVVVKEELCISTLSQVSPDGRGGGGVAENSDAGRDTLQPPLEFLSIPLSPLEERSCLTDVHLSTSVSAASDRQRELCAGLS